MFINKGFPMFNKVRGLPGLSTTGHKIKAGHTSERHAYSVTIDNKKFDRYFGNFK